MALPYIERRDPGPLECLLGSYWGLTPCVLWRPCRSHADENSYRRVRNVCIGSSAPTSLPEFCQERSTLAA